LELIDVKGSDPATVEILRTQRGPLIQFDGAGAYYTRQWVRESTSGTVAAYFDLSSATTLEEASLALSKWAGPGQNLVLADTVGVRGRVGYFPAGRWPRRESEDGRWPRLGSSLTAAPPALNSEWPVLFDPAEGRIVTANHRVAFGPEGDVVSRYWPLPWRAWRIEERLQAADALDVDSMADIQMDPATIPSIRWAAWFRENDAPPGASADAGRAWQILASWDGRMVDGAAPTIYRTALQALPWVLFADDWPQGWSDSSPDRWTGEVGRLPLERATLRIYGILGDEPLAAALNSLDTRDWFDDASTSQRESPADCMAEALAQTVRVLRDRYGNVEEDWRWERHHTLTVRHPLSSLPILGSLLQVGPLPLNGDRHAILANAARNQDNLTVDSIPVMRMIFDLGDPSRSRFVVAGGQSGHVLSRWFADQLPVWARGESFALYGARGKTTGDTDVPAAAGLRLVLRPVSGSNQP